MRIGIVVEGQRETRVQAVSAIVAASDSVARSRALLTSLCGRV